MNLLPLGTPGPTAGAGLPAFLAEAPPFVLPFGVKAPVESEVIGTALPTLAADALPTLPEGGASFSVPSLKLKAEQLAPGVIEHPAQATAPDVTPPQVLAAPDANTPLAVPAPGTREGSPHPTTDEVLEAPNHTAQPDEADSTATAASLASPPEILVRPVLPPPFPPPPLSEPLPGDERTVDSPPKLVAEASPLLPQPSKSLRVAAQASKAKHDTAPEVAASPSSEHNEPSAYAAKTETQLRALPELPASIAAPATPPSKESVNALSALTGERTRLPTKASPPSAPRGESNDNHQDTEPRQPTTDLIDPPVPRSSTALIKQAAHHASVDAQEPLRAAPRPLPSEQPEPPALVVTDPQPSATSAITTRVSAPPPGPTDQAAPVASSPLAPASPVAASHAPPPADDAAAPLPRVDATTPRFAEHVGIAITRRPGGLQPGDELVLQIEPAHLGRIRVELNFAPDGKLEALVTADQLRVLDQLKLHSADLHRALIEAGGRNDIAAPRFEPRQDSGGSFAPPSGGSAQQQFASGNGGNSGQSPHQPRTSFAYPADARPDPERPAQQLRTAAGRLDLIA